LFDRFGEQAFESMPAVSRHRRRSMRDTATRARTPSPRAPYAPRRRASARSRRS
jgi:hypothetical protein